MITSKSIQTNLVELQPNLFRFALHLTSNRDDAFDLLQDTNLKVLENTGRFTPESNFRSWVFTIMQNTFFNLYQRSRHPLAQTASLESDYPSVVGRADTAMSPQQRCEMSEIMKAVRSLRSDHRTAISMFIQGYRYKEISHITGTSEIVVKNNIALARRSLLSSLAAYRV